MLTIVQSLSKRNFFPQNLICFVCSGLLKKEVLLFSIRLESFVDSSMIDNFDEFFFFFFFFFQLSEYGGIEKKIHVVEL